MNPREIMVSTSNSISRAFGIDFCVKQISQNQGNVDMGQTPSGCRSSAKKGGKINPFCL